MRVFLKEIRFKGIKNIADYAHIRFTKKDVKKRKDLNASNVKAIYGPNGSGKTALVYAFMIFKLISMKKNYLLDDAELTKLYELTNKKTKEIDLKFIFLFEEDDDKFNIYEYETKVSNIKNEFIITYEKYSTRDSEYAKSKIIYEVIDGHITHHNFKVKENYFSNLLNKRPLHNIWLFLDLKDSEKKHWSQDVSMFLPLLAFIDNINILLDTKDSHDTVKNKSNLENFNVKELKEIASYSKDAFILGYNSKKVDQEELEILESEIQNKSDFIRMFKPEIESFFIEKRLVETIGKVNYYQINEFIDYGDYQVDLEFESMGIKKLLELYVMLKQLTRGEIVIIDELDSHINDIYLIKLIEYVSEYLDGQLIFTTHNVSPMEVLKSKKYGIDFMTQDGHVVSWTQIGNYSPTKMYQQGMIGGLPFNLSKEDFLSVLGDGK